ncbi:O-acetyltransferase OatA [compost metagenome]
MGNQTIKKHDYIDAIRGIAIILVVLTHSSQYVKPVSDFLIRIMAEGARGVQLFYVASAVTLCMSWAARKSNEINPIRNFYLRRFFRIAPMFYLAIVGYLALNGLAATYWAPNGIEWWFIPVTALFLHGFHPETINSVVPGGWSIAVEMTFYLVFPLLMRFRNLWLYIALFVVVVLLQRWNAPTAAKLFAYPPEQAYMTVNFSALNFISQFPVFIMGIVAYLFLKRERVRSLKMFAIGAPLLCFFGYKFWVFSLWPVTHDVYTGAMFAVFLVFVAYYPMRLLVNKVTVTLGKLSFSMYLTHFAVLNVLAKLGFDKFLGGGNAESFLYFLTVLAIAAAVSGITYTFIEKPGVALGRHLIDRLEKTKATSTSLIPS